MKEIVPLTKEQKALASGAMTELRRLGESYVLRYPANLREDLLQELLHAAAMAAVDWDPQRGASFVTYAFGCGVCAVIKHSKRAWTEAKRQLTLRMIDAATGIAAIAPQPTQEELFRTSDADQQRRLADLNDALAVAMALAVVRLATPEMELLVAEDRVRVRAALDEILATFSADERRLILRRFVHGEELTSLFGPVALPAYRAGTKRFYALVARLGGEFRRRGIGPSTARTIAEIDLGANDATAPTDG